MVEWVGRRLTACICMAAACLCALMFAMAPASGALALAAACVFNGISVGGWNSLDVVSAELYPTVVRSSGMGLLGTAGRLASLAFTYLSGERRGRGLWAWDHSFVP